MKHVVTRILSSAAIVVLASAATAETLTWGQLEVEFGKNRISDTEGNADAIFERNPTTLDLSGKFGADIGQFGAQVDLRYGRTNIPTDEYTGFEFGNLAALHLNYDIASTVVMGAQIGTGNTQPADDDDASIDFYALEGAGGIGNVMVAGQIGRFDSEDPDETDAYHDGKFVQVSGIYTLGTSGVIEAELGYFDGKQDSGALYDMYGTTWGVKYSRQFAAEPFAWSVGLDGGSFSNGTAGDNGAYDETRVTLGLSTWFGDDDLAGSKKRGILGQPDFARVGAAGTNVD